MLTPLLRTPAQVLSLTFRRQKPTQEQLDGFQAARRQLLAELDPDEDEENAKKRIGSFLERVLPGYDFNNRSKRDFVMRRGPATTDPVGVIFEMKHLNKEREMPTPTDINQRAMHQLVYYYMQDRADHSGDTVTHLTITNGHDWYVFDGHDFDRLFWRNTEFNKQFRQFEAGGYASKKRDFFYDSIAQPFLAALEGTLPMTHVNLEGKPGSITGQVQLLKLFSDTHLLRLPLPGADGNTLNRAFYTELLYLMGLEEVTEKNRKLIRRCAEGRRHAASLLENAMEQLRAENLLERLPPAEREAYGPDDQPEQQREEVALALCLTWVSRLLFLKLLEGQLRRYHGAQGEEFRFLRPDEVQEYDHLNRLFYRVLNRPRAERGPRELAEFDRVPYLNSTLFEPAALEQATLRISNLDDRLPLPLLAGKAGRSVLAPDPQPPTTALAYLMRFLEAYDFSSEGAEEVQAQAKPLISASVLGLIFEKINGYQDGSFYTPGFVTMYMCHHTLRRAVVQHFNRHYGWQAQSLADLRDRMLDHRPAAPAEQAAYRDQLAAHFGTLRVCDPAVGSGHFLVSALNELLVIKAELRLIRDQEGTLPYRLSIDRDELVVQDEDNNLVAYRATYHPATGRRTVGPQFTRLQQALFREKRQLLEHTLFGVDLNPNSVRICRLRLWIELLKHAYYRPEEDFQDLETLPNLDLNVQAGNSLLARFPLSEDLGDMSADPAQNTLTAYKQAITAYFNVTGHTDKTALQNILAGFKQSFRTNILLRDPLNKELIRYDNELLQLKIDSAPDMYGNVRLPERVARAKGKKLRDEMAKAESAIFDREHGTLYRDAFEWRFEFPEILSADGSFRGFDVVIGNPPYIRADDQDPAQRRAIMNSGRFVTLAEKWDLYVAFLELGYQLLAPGGTIAMIVSDAYNHAKYAKTSQEWFLKNAVVQRLDFFTGFSIFKEANVGSIIPFFEKRSPTVTDIPERRLHITEFNNVEDLPSLPQVLADNRLFVPQTEDSHIELEGTLLNLICYISVGMVVHANESGSQGAFGLDDLVSDAEDDLHPVPFSEGKNLDRWLPRQHRWLEWGTDRAPALFRRPTFPQLYEVPEKLIAADISAAGAALKVCYDNQQLFHNHSAWSFVPWHSLAGVRNRSLQKATRYEDEKLRPDLPRREDLERTSEQFEVKYLLAIMNSATARTFLNGIRRSNIHLYPDDWKQLPIPPATTEEQTVIAGWVQQILEAKAADPAADTLLLEQQIDAEVARLFEVG